MSFDILLGGFSSLWGISCDANFDVLYRFLFGEGEVVGKFFPLFFVYVMWREREREREREKERERERGRERERERKTEFW